MRVTDRATALLRRIGALDGTLRCYVALDESAILREAARLDAVPLGARGPLHGLTLAVKDLIDVAGLPTRAGSAFFRRDPPCDAPVVAALRAAGALVVGKTNTHEFAWGVTTENPHFGRTANPWDVARSAGGSSGGSGAAVAAGLADCALGTDTLGSIRIPAALNGICGLRPPFGVLSLDGIFPLAPGFDTVGPLARDVVLLERLYAVLSPASAPVADAARVCRLRGGGWERVDRAVAGALDDAVAALRRDGVAVAEVAWWDAELEPAVATLQQREAAAVHASLYARHADAYGADVGVRVARALTVTADAEDAARVTLAGARRSFATATAGYAVALVPGAPAEAPLSPAPAAFRGRTMPLETVASAFGLAAVAVPIGFGPAGMPLGLQIVALEDGARPALALGARFQKVTAWHRRSPDLAGLHNPR